MLSGSKRTRGLSLTDAERRRVKACNDVQQLRARTRVAAIAIQRLNWVEFRDAANGRLIGQAEV